MVPCPARDRRVRSFHNGSTDAVHIHSSNSHHHARWNAPLAALVPWRTHANKALAVQPCLVGRNRASSRRHASYESNRTPAHQFYTPNPPVTTVFGAKKRVAHLVKRAFKCGPTSTTTDVFTRFYNVVREVMYWGSLRWTKEGST